MARGWIATLVVLASTFLAKMTLANDAQMMPRRHTHKEKVDPFLEIFRENMRKISPDQHVSGDTFVALLRIPSSGASILTKVVKISSHGCSCDFKKCQCQTNSIRRHLGIPCSQMTCVHKCRVQGCFHIWSHGPHADWLELQNAFLRERIPKKKALVFTMLRDPVQRLLSEHHWIQQRATHNCDAEDALEPQRFGLDLTVPCEQLSFPQFIELKDVRKRVINRQTRMLAGVGDFDEGELYLTPEEMLASAKRNLAEMAWFGIYERFNESVWLLEKQAEGLGITVEISHQDHLQHIKKLRSGGTFSSSLLSKANALDEELYKFAVKLFEQRLAAARKGEAVRRQVARLDGGSSSATFAKCVSGLCAKSPFDAYEGVRWQNPPREEDYDPLLHWRGNYLDEIHFGDTLMMANDDCNYHQGAQQHTYGTFKSYRHLGGCALHSDWFRRNIYFVNGSEPYFFSTRSEYPFERLDVGKYIVAIGDSATMGVLSNRSYLSRLEHALDMPTVTIAYGNVGAGFYVGLLNQQDSPTLAGRALRDILEGARVVIIQGMRVEAEWNARCKGQCGTTFCDDGVPFNDKMESLDKGARRGAIKESQSKWLAHHEQLLDVAATMRKPSMRRTVAYLDFPIVLDGDRGSHDYPQYVTDAMTEKIEKRLQDISSIANTRAIHLSLANDGSMASRFLRVPKGACGAKTKHDRTETVAYLATHSLECGIHTVEGAPCRTLDTFPFVPYELHWKAGIRLYHHLVAEARLTDDEAEPRGVVPALEEPKATKGISFFMLITKGKIGVKTRVPLVTTETACKNNPGSTFYIYRRRNKGIVVDDEFGSVLLEGNCTMYLLPFDHMTFFHGTPLDSWMDANQDRIVSGPFWRSHQTDFFRSAVLWKYGGWYIDADVLFLRPLSGLQNCVSFESKTTRIVNNAISTFSRNHMVLTATMTYITTSYEPKNWLGAGPGALSDVLGTWYATNCVGPACVKIMPLQTFFPLGIFDPIFSPDMSRDGVGQSVGDAYGIHLWNSRTHTLIPTPMSVYTQLYRENCITCILARNASTD
mmetsp:Transcript_3605/g.14184  ORF Transcript_3605/g.14184 Transcript_3605/m.14184 type:complete len:1047 (-) Transcript_3605:60-3200(-)